MPKYPDHLVDRLCTECVRTGDGDGVIACCDYVNGNALPEQRELVERCIGDHLERDPQWGGGL